MECLSDVNWRFSLPAILFFNMVTEHPASAVAANWNFFLPFCCSHSIAGGASASVDVRLTMIVLQFSGASGAV